ncbi:hypothetical protein LTR16_006806, partial [Cryomyces antarcticus]
DNDAILLNQILAPQTDMLWRAALVFFIALPLGLSAAYKEFFKGGISTMALSSMAIMGNQTHYGMFAPPGLSPL